MSEERGKRRRSLSIRRSTLIIVIADLIIGALLLYAMYRTGQQFGIVQNATEKYAEYRTLTEELKEGIDQLSDIARAFSVRSDPGRVILYYNEISVTRRRNHAYERLTAEIEDPRVLKHLESVMKLSEAMREAEAYSMRLAIAAREESLSQYPEALQRIEIREEDRGLSREEMLRKARNQVFGPNYENLYGQMKTRISLSVDHLLESLQETQLSGTIKVNHLMRNERVLVGMFLLMLGLAVAFIIWLVIRPLKRNISLIEREEMLEEEGASELAFLARTYNTMLTQVRKSRSQLTYEASHDGLTGLYNRNAYEDFIAAAQGKRVALLILDVDHFKQFNDVYGHDIGDKVLRRLSEVLQHIFRGGDRICRIGGDEFAVLMENIGKEQGDILRDRISRAAEEMRKPTDDIPSATLSVGAAFPESADENRTLFKCADTALYSVKHLGGDGFCIYENDQEEN